MKCGTELEKQTVNQLNVSWRNSRVCVVEEVKQICETSADSFRGFWL